MDSATSEKRPDLKRPVDQADDPESLSGLRNKARQHVEEAINKLPKEKKEAYLEAKEKSPELVKLETDPLIFVRRCDYNVGAAAERLCLYWKERKDIFGPERAFLPLVLSGQGALTPDDVQWLNAGFPALLPDTIDGRKVILFDRRQWLAKDQGTSRLRCMFYASNILAESERAQVDGVLGLIYMVTPRIYKTDFDFAGRALRLARDALPIKFDWHILNWLPKTGKRYVVQRTITEAATLMLDIYGQHHFDIHIERYAGQLAAELQELGMKKEDVPLCVGGEWKLDDFARWRHEQHDVENTKYGEILAESGQPVLDQSEESDGKDDEAKKQAKLRLTNMIHSRRKRQRRRQEFQDLEARASRLEEERESLMAENARLQHLWIEAQSVLAFHGVGVAQGSGSNTQC